jgi:uncharacterized damage-inducible protein DinB
MRLFAIAAMLLVGLCAIAQDSGKPTLKSILLQQLRETHNQKNWFVSEKEAVAGLTPEQAAWNDGKNHGVGQLLAHLNYWNSINLQGMKGGKPKATDNNDDTFKFSAQQWDAAQKEFEKVMSDIEAFVQSADDATLAKIAPNIARVAQHNAYHLAEMVTSRKSQGTWNPETGVK